MTVEQTSSDPRLDRKVYYDPRSLNFRIRDLPAAGQPLKSRAWRTPVVLDQGREGACVGFAWTHRAATWPKAWKPTLTNEDALALYHDAQRDDDMPGENYEGSSTLGGAKASAARGRVGSYHWATTIEEVLQALANVGPVVVGINWYDGMYQPQGNKLVVSGSLVGGHDILINAINVTREEVRFHNSWGADWGHNGEAWMSFADVERLIIKESGDACVSLKP